jgi:hypothetical protein
MVFKIMKAASSFYAVDYNEKKQQKGLAEKYIFKTSGTCRTKTSFPKRSLKSSWMITLPGITVLKILSFMQL